MDDLVTRMCAAQVPDDLIEIARDKGKELLLLRLENAAQAFKIKELEHDLAETRTSWERRFRMSVDHHTDMLLQETRKSRKLGDDVHVLIDGMNDLEDENVRLDGEVLRLRGGYRLIGETAALYESDGDAFIAVPLTVEARNVLLRSLARPEADAVGADD